MMWPFGESEKAMLRRVNREHREEIEKLRDKLEAAEATATSALERVLEMVGRANGRLGGYEEPLADTVIRQQFGCPGTVWVVVDPAGIPYSDRPMTSLEQADDTVAHSFLRMRIMKYVFAGEFRKEWNR